MNELIIPLIETANEVILSIQADPIYDAGQALVGLVGCLLAWLAMELQ